MWVIHWALLLWLPWRTWVWPYEGQVGGGAFLGLQGYWKHQVLRGVGW